MKNESKAYVDWLVRNGKYTRWMFIDADFAIIATKCRIIIVDMASLDMEQRRELLESDDEALMSGIKKLNKWVSKEFDLQNFVNFSVDVDESTVDSISNGDIEISVAHAIIEKHKREFLSWTAKSLYKVARMSKYVPDESWMDKTAYNPTTERGLDNIDLFVDTIMAYYKINTK